MKNYFLGLTFVLLAVLSVYPATVRAETAVTTSVKTSENLSGLLELLQSLMKQVESLQKQLAEIKGEIREEIRGGLAEGMENDDIRKIQELLATDPSIYPRGIVSGYYGSLTREAIENFQKRHDLPVTGKIDEATKDLMQEYFKEKKEGKLPPGLLKAPGISKKILERWREKDGKNYLDCEDKTGSAFLCKEDKSDKDRATSTTNKVTSTSTVNSAIKKAEDKIDDLEDKIKEIKASSTVRNTREANESLSKAKRLLISAEDELEKNKLRPAYDYATEAYKVSQAALEKLAKEYKERNKIDDEDNEDNEEDDNNEDDADDES